MEFEKENQQKRVLLLMSPATYRAGAFLSAAKKLNIEVIVGIDLPEQLSEYWHVPLGLDFLNPDASVRTMKVPPGPVPRSALRIIPHRLPRPRATNC